jgi:membrane protein implicated in regulation of membrane protease activity
LLWVLIVVGSAAGAVAFGFLSYWIAFILFAVATLLAIAQLVRIRLRKPVQGGGGQRW